LRRLSRRSDRRNARFGPRTAIIDVPRVGTRAEWSIELHALAEQRARAQGLPESAWRAELARGFVSVR
jgi:hypothetical protein